MGSQPTPRTSGPREIAVTSIKIERDQLDAFKLVAAANRRTVSAELRWLMDQHIAAFKHDQLETEAA